MRPAKSMILLALAALALAVPAGATNYVPMTDAALVDAAPLAAVVRITGITAGPPSDLPATFYRAEVEEVLKGTLEASPILVRVPGGVTADGQGWKVYGAPRFGADERALLLLVPRADGSFGIEQMMLGAFHETERDGFRLAVRDLSAAQAVPAPGTASAAATTAGGARDFATFAAWVRDRAAGDARPADYRLDVAAPTSPYAHVSADYQLLDDEGQCGATSRPIRWFLFDDGGTVRWTADAVGQSGMAGGGFAELRRALAAWTDDPDSDVRLTYTGQEVGGDAHVSWDDPDDEIAGSFSGGGTLAIGGPWFDCKAKSWNGGTFRPAVRGFIVTQDGAGSWFAGNGGKDGEEVFAHEVGHSLGLGHSTVAQALMRAYAYGDGRGARLSDDERAALAALYGTAGAGPEGGGDPQAPPAAPDRLAGRATAPTEVRLSWRDRSSGEDGFALEVAAGDGAFRELGGAPAGATGATVTSLESGTSYRFRVRARNGYGASAPTDPVAVATPSALGPCDPGALCLLDGRFQIDVVWHNQHRGGGDGVGRPLPATGETGYFWFFDPNNVELVVKMLDGRPLNGSFWLFYGGLSDVGYDVRVRDRVAGVERTYHNAPGQICGRGDTVAFPAPATAGDAWLSAASPEPAAPASADGATDCGGDDRSLCLADGRFRVRVEWVNQHPGGGSGVGRVRPEAFGGGTTGFFWFFDRSNVELVTKVIDGRALNGHFWFFFGALSDVAYDIHVRDTVSGQERTYHNQPGEICGRGDTAAF